MNEKRFRLSAQHLFLTYPQCPLSKPDALALLMSKAYTSPIRHYAIAQETHADGSLHLHAYLGFRDRVFISRKNHLDLDQYHGKYETCKSPWHTCNVYFVKEDQNVLTNITDEERKHLKGKIQGGKDLKIKIAKKIIEGEELFNLVEEYPHLIFGYKRLKDDIKEYRESLLVFKDLPTFLPNPWGILINTGLRKDRHWWIYSTQPNKGKTTWARQLEATYGMHIKSGDFTYWNITGREPGLVIDEYNVPSLKYHVLNQMADGLFEYRIFMGGLRRIVNPLIIILSNQNLIDLYPHMNHLIMARFNIKCID